MTRSVVPNAFWKLTWPPLPRGTSTRLAIVTPLVQFRYDEFGIDWPVGQTVRKLHVVVLVAVTFKTTPTAFAGTPLLPAIVRSSRPFFPRWLPAFAWPLPLRVSVILVGGWVLNRPD